MKLFWCFIVLLFLESYAVDSCNYAPLVDVQTFVFSISLRVINGPRVILSTNNISAAQKPETIYQYSTFVYALSLYVIEANGLWMGSFH